MLYLPPLKKWVSQHKIMNAKDYFVVNVINEKMNRIPTLVVRALENNGILATDKEYSTRMDKEATHLTVQGEDGFNLEADIIFSPYETYIVLNHIYVNGEPTQINNQEIIEKQICCSNDFFVLCITDGCSPARQKAVVDWSEGVFE